MRRWRKWASTRSKRRTWPATWAGRWLTSGAASAVPAAVACALFVHPVARGAAIAIAAMGADPTPQGHAQFAPFVVDQLAVWKRQIGIAGMKPQ